MLENYKIRQTISRFVSSFLDILLLLILLTAPRDTLLQKKRPKDIMNTN